MKIIVLTPIKNEEWILERFLKACSLFADHILIADQNSTDDSVQIANKFEKVTVINNNSEGFNEAGRQLLLIDKARELFGDGNFLLGLDADEIITADSLNSTDWNVIKNSKIGTVFHFERPAPFFDLKKTIRYIGGFPMGYKDDGAKHNAISIHSTRIPTPQHATHVIISGIRFLHLCLVRENNIFSKLRFYCVIENIDNVRNLRNRRKLYGAYKRSDSLDGQLEDIKPEWLEGYKEKGIDLSNFNDQQYYWMDFEVLRLFNKHGVQRFYNDSIWNFDWESCRQEGIRRNEHNMPPNFITPPANLRIKVLDIIFKSIKNVTQFKNRMLK